MLSLALTAAFILVAALLAFMLGVSEYLLVYHTSGLTLSIAGIFKVCKRGTYRDQQKIFTRECCLLTCLCCICTICDIALRECCTCSNLPPLYRESSQWWPESVAF